MQLGRAATEAGQVTVDGLQVTGTGNRSQVTGHGSRVTGHRTVTADDGGSIGRKVTDKPGYICFDS